MPPSSEVYAVTAPGVESILAAECVSHGLEVVGTEPGGVMLRGGAGTIYRANLELRTANRVLVRIAEFPARLFPELERRAARVPWGEVVAPGARVEFRVTARKSRLYHQDAIAERLVEAVTSRISGVESGARGSAPPPAEAESAGPDVAQSFVVRVLRDRFTVSADSSGALLHRRGYRLATAKAPLRETLAAALLLASEWNGVAPLVDPFTGSGTIPIEAALLARRIAPGLGRRFGFERWPCFEAERWRELVARARERVVPRAPGTIQGFDRDAGAVAAAIANAERAGVAGDVEFERRTVSALPALVGTGWIVTNPPYGGRMGERRALRDLYATFGTVLRDRCPAARLALFVARLEHARALAIPLAPRFGTTNGGIRVRAMVAGSTIAGARRLNASGNPGSGG
jgi:putative N6-adenine-specific DNA methylase